MTGFYCFLLFWFLQFTGLWVSWFLWFTCVLVSLLLWFLWFSGFSGFLVSLVFWLIDFFGFSGLPLLHLGLWVSAVCRFMSLMVSLVSCFIDLLVNWFCWISGLQFYLIYLLIGFPGLLVSQVYWFLRFTGFSGLLFFLVSLVFNYSIWVNWFLPFAGLLASLWRCSFSTSDLRYIDPIQSNI